MKNRLKADIEQEEKLTEQIITAPETEPAPVPKKSNKVGRAVSSVVSGRFLISEPTLKYMPFIFFLAFLGLLYIANGYFAQSKDRELDTLNTQIKELNTQYQIAKAKLMYLSKESEVARATAGIGLKESVIPPEKIVIDNKLAKK
ncbi:MAG: FtsL-like putative cell division protein [Bacteroidia bacterium]